MYILSRRLAKDLSKNIVLRSLSRIVSCETLIKIEQFLGVVD